MNHRLHVERGEHVRVQQRRREVVVENLQVRGVQGACGDQGRGVDPGRRGDGVERRRWRVGQLGGGAQRVVRRAHLFDPVLVAARV